MRSKRGILMFKDEGRPDEVHRGAHLQFRQRLLRGSRQPVDLPGVRLTARLRNFQGSEDHLLRLWTDRQWKDLHYDGNKRWCRAWFVPACQL